MYALFVVPRAVIWAITASIDHIATILFQWIISCALMAGFFFLIDHLPLQLPFLVIFFATAVGISVALFTQWAAYVYDKKPLFNAFPSVGKLFAVIIVMNICLAFTFLSFDLVKTMAAHYGAYPNWRMGMLLGIVFLNGILLAFSLCVVNGIIDNRRHQVPLQSLFVPWLMLVALCAFFWFAALTIFNALITAHNVSHWKWLAGISAFFTFGLYLLTATTVYVYRKRALALPTKIKTDS